MKLLKHIEDAPYSKDLKVKKRFAVRAVLTDEKGFTPVVFASKMNYHKIPGGGIEKGENKINALMREIYEESGCKVEIDGEVGKITEYRSKYEWFQFQTSYCYYGKVLSKGQPHFDEGEIAEGFSMNWETLDEAIKILSSDKPKDYEGNFIQKRDLAFLIETKKLIEKVKK